MHFRFIADCLIYVLVIFRSIFSYHCYFMSASVDRNCNFNTICKYVSINSGVFEKTLRLICLDRQVQRGKAICLIMKKNISFNFGFGIDLFSHYPICLKIEYYLHFMIDCFESRRSNTITFARAAIWFQKKKLFNGKVFIWTSRNKFSYHLLPNILDQLDVFVVILTIGSNRKNIEILSN